MKPSTPKPNRLDRLDRLELIMADQDALGMNDEIAPRGVARSHPTGPDRDHARHLLHYLTDDVGTRNGNARKAGR